VELLKVFEFDSTRRRMSIIVRDNGIIKLYMKGADDEIFNRLDDQNEQPFFARMEDNVN